MAEQEVKRIKVSALLDAELPQREVARIANVRILTVQHFAAAKRADQSTERKHGSRTTQHVTQDEFIEKLLDSHCQPQGLPTLAS